MPHSQRRHLLTTLLTTRRGILALTFAAGALVLLLRPSTSTPPSLPSHTPDGHQAGVPAGYREQFKQGWASWRAASGVEDGAGLGELSEAMGREAGVRPVKDKVVWHLAEQKTAEGDMPVDRDAMFVHSGKNGDSEEKEDVDTVDGAESTSAKDDLRHVDPIEAKERKPAGKERPFGDKNKDPSRPGHDLKPAKTESSGLLSDDDFEELDAAAEEERLAAQADSRTSHSSHHSSSSPSSDDSSSSSDADDLDTSASDDLTVPAIPQPDEDFVTDEELDAYNDWPTIDAEEAGDGASDADYDVEEVAEADAPSIAAQEDARSRAPMAALAKVEEGKNDEPREPSPAKGGRVVPHKAVKLPSADSIDDLDVVEDDEPSPPSPQRPAKPLLNGGKKVGTGGKLLSGEERPVLDAVAKAKLQPQRAKGGGVVGAEAGRRVGTGARPGAKGMGAGEVERRRW